MAAIALKMKFIKKYMKIFFVYCYSIKSPNEWKNIYVKKTTATDETSVIKLKNWALVVRLSLHANFSFILFLINMSYYVHIIICKNKVNINVSLFFRQFTTLVIIILINDYKRKTYNDSILHIEIGIYYN